MITVYKKHGMQKFHHFYVKGENSSLQRVKVLICTYLDNVDSDQTFSGFHWCNVLQQIWMCSVIALSNGEHSYHTLQDVWGRVPDRSTAFVVINVTTERSQLKRCQHD